MLTADLNDRDLLDLAQETAEVADCIDDPAVCARLHEIAQELREMALSIPD